MMNKRVAKVLIIVFAVVSFPLSGWYVVWSDNQQTQHLCEEAQERYDVIFGILNIVKRNASHPETLTPYYDLLGRRPDC